MKFTGERFVPTEQGKIRLEHYHRYALVLDAVCDKQVLDVACGEGYGSAMMASAASSVHGLDVSEEAVAHARVTYLHQSNLAFSVGSATDMPFGDAAFDVVVSFETIEHLLEQEKMLDEIRRVLRPNGILIISSPNRPVYSGESGEHNEFHVKELDFIEFDSLLRPRFGNIQYFGQRILMGSVIQSTSERHIHYKAWHDNGVALLPGTCSLADPVYFLAVCGRIGQMLPDLGASIVHPEALDLVKHYVGFAKWAKDVDKTIVERDRRVYQLSETVENLEGELARVRTDFAAEKSNFEGRFAQYIFKIEALLGRSQTDARHPILQADAIEKIYLEIVKRDAYALVQAEKIAKLQYELDVRDQDVSSWKEESFKRGEWALRLTRELHEKSEELTLVRRSTSWRITAPMREAKKWGIEPIKQSRRYTKKLLRSTKKLYQVLPIDYKRKAAIRRAVATSFPSLLIQSGSPAATIPHIIDKALKSVEDGKVARAALLLNNNQIRLMTSTEPLVSVIIPIYGKIEYTLQCLESIEKNPPSIRFEVLVVDDCSPDNSLQLLERVEGIRIVKNEKNQGFIRSCNAGATAAVAPYLCFLNNDTEVFPQWLEELLRTFHEFPECGFAGSKLIYPDGRLQEAGGIIWQDGSAWNFGRLQDPLLPVYNYAREVDYCSGASIMVPTKLFKKLGGFDEHFLPAYCEDADLALKIRDHGFRVIYQPLSTVIHHEGITSGTDTTHGVKSYQITNSKKLLERWRHRLEKHQPNGENVYWAKDRQATRRVLVLDHCTPTPDEDSGSIDTFNLMLLLREMNFQVTFMPEDNFCYMEKYTAALQRIGIEVLYAPYVRTVESHIKEFGKQYDLVFLIRPVVAERHLRDVRKFCPKAKVIFHTVDLHYLRMTRESAYTGNQKLAIDADQMRQRESSLISAVDVATVISSEEYELLRKDLPSAKVRLLPYARDIAGTNASFADRRDVMFVGGFQHVPNIDAVLFFANEVMPHLREKIPGIRFHIVGSKATPEILQLAREDVIVTGYVEDLNAMMDNMRVSVAPLRFGAGIKGKIGSAMAAGLPVVSTTLGAEGMSLTHRQEVMLADAPEEFAATVAELYQNQELWNCLSEASLVFAEKAWGASAAWRNLAAILCELDMPVSRSEKPLSLYRELSVDLEQKFS